ncbi:nicotinate-nucleotide adenylyltransferase [Caenimonas koreensis]|uniref:nicotinate-nucleotide adenylyltransferase n=1 Tax=Caenimonas koreensis TaxID=367474 RepID=UPI003783B3BD
MTGPGPARIGVFGGAFDPPHVAHVALARAAVSQLALDELRIFPTGQAWHKSNQLTPPDDRLAMAQIAFGGLARTVVDDRELRRPGATYTIDTLRELVAQHPHAQIFLVMGQDQAVAFTSWREWQAILAMATLAVAARPSAIAAHDHPGLPAQARVQPLALPAMPDSATHIRQLVARGEGIAELVPQGVASYIASHHLYQRT